MTAKRPFMPDYGAGNGPLAGGAASAKTTIRKGANNLRILVVGTGVGYIRTFNTGAIANNSDIASAADYPVTGGIVSTLTKSEAHDGLAYIGAGLTFYPITGEGW